MFRGKFIFLLKKAYQQGKLLAYFDDFEAFLNLAVSEDWVVRTKPPFGGPEIVLKYLARYTHRVAISNRRLVALENGNVSFRYRNYRTMEQKTMTLSATEFLRRFLLHLLPKGFVRVRYYGFLTRAKRKASLQKLRAFLGMTHFPEKPTTNPHTRRCPRCKAEAFIIITEITSSLQAHSFPPANLAAPPAV